MTAQLRGQPSGKSKPPTEEGHPGQLVPLKALGVDKSRRIGAARGRLRVPADIDTANPEIARLFVGGCR